MLHCRSMKTDDDERTELVDTFTPLAAVVLAIVERLTREICEADRPENEIRNSSPNDHVRRTITVICKVVAHEPAPVMVM